MILLGQSWCYGQDNEGEPTPSRPWIMGQAGSFSGPIATDRPTFSLSPATIPKGRIQIETGYTFSLEKASPDVKTHNFPETLVRIGLTEIVEFRVEWPTLTYIDNGQDVNGFNDLALGFKVQVLQQQGFRPRLSFVGRLSIPTGDKDFSSDRVDPLFRTILTYAVNERVGLFGTVNVGSPTSQGTRFVQVSSSLGLSAAIRDRLTGFVEYFGLYPRDVASGSANFLQTGVLYHLTDNLQLDVRVGGGLTHGSDDFLTGAGISWRF
ncbi:transporter [Candidatus Nitrospira allomarina]|uniref:Transporter n=1 Tax=Candidatus Nitrospira allomarina TaxID=3020900 RepID=A0AA96GAY1_9BACT|nr:transporter [Candidatus Nitrospira allomarina]WNM57977.1 transporter [Candidatus Nitrospira allomarina]